MNYLKLFVLFAFLVGHTLFAQLPLENGRLHGHFEQFNPKDKTTVTGNFKDNVRVGKWTIKHDTSDLVYKREYSNMYSFNTSLRNDDELIKNQFDLVRDSNGVYKYPEVLDSNIVWSKRVWSILTVDNNKEVYSSDLLSKITELVKKNEINIYANDEFTVLVNKESFEITGQELDKITFKKDYYYDESLELMVERIVAINFHLKNDEKQTSFSLYYPTDGRKLFSSLKLGNVENIKHLDDLIYTKKYSDIIYDEEKMSGERVSPDLNNPENHLAFSNRIKTLIINAEHGFWLNH